MPRKKIKQFSESPELIEIKSGESELDIFYTNKTSEKDSGEDISMVSSTTSLKSNIKILQTEDDIIDINQLKGKEIWHYSMLEKFFSTCDLAQIQRMVDIINGNHLISLRFLDWFVTRYCFLYKTTINVTNMFCVQKNFNINISYKAQLKSFTKKYFDPFKRKKKFFFTIDKYKISLLTTLGQLNFFRWAISHDIINNTEINYRTIVSKYDYVNSFFKKQNSSNSTNSTNMSNNSSNVNSDSLDSTSMINNIYSSTNSNIIIEEEEQKKKSTFKIPRVSRNIYLEL